MNDVTMDQLIRAYNIARSLNHDWAKAVWRGELRTTFAVGGMRAVFRLVEARLESYDSRRPRFHPVPETSSVTENGRIRWAATRAGGLVVKISQPRGTAPKLVYNPSGRLTEVIPGQPLAPVSDQDVAKVARIVTAAFHPASPEWVGRMEHEIRTALAVTAAVG